MVISDFKCDTNFRTVPSGKRHTDNAIQTLSVHEKLEVIETRDVERH